MFGFILTECFPDFFVGFFLSDNVRANPESSALPGFTSRVMRIMMIFLPVNGFQIVATNFFVVTGRPAMSIFLSMLRQCIALIPCIFIFGNLWGLWGVVAATPVADGFAFICTAFLTVLELRKLKTAHSRTASGRRNV
jgi:Na+-driven multidrug efflux pump